MKKRVLSLSLALVLLTATLAGCGGKKNATWKVTCPWAPSGVAAMVSQQAATKSTSYSDTITLVAEAQKGDAATVNTWVADTKANDTELVFVGEGLLSITSILDPAKLQFGYEDFVFVENLYSSIFVLSADASLGINSIAELKALYGKILADKEVADWLHDTMLLEVDTMSVADVEAHIDNVKDIVNQYKDIVAG